MFCPPSGVSKEIITFSASNQQLERICISVLPTIFSVRMGPSPLFGSNVVNLPDSLHTMAKQVNQSFSSKEAHLTNYPAIRDGHISNEQFLSLSFICLCFVNSVWLLLGYELWATYCAQYRYYCIQDKARKRGNEPGKQEAEIIKWITTIWALFLL